MNGQRTPQITLFGNLGGDPETRTLKGRTVTREAYDIVTDEVIVREHTTDDRQIRIASLAVNGKDDNGDEISRWHRLVDFADHLDHCLKGDRLKVTGYFRDRPYVKDGEEKTIRELIVTAAAIQPKRVRPTEEDEPQPF
jgi:single-stranded DNA-binding protein